MRKSQIKILAYITRKECLENLTLTGYIKGTRDNRKQTFLGGWKGTE